MRIVRFKSQTDTRYGVVDRDVIHEMRGDLPDFFSRALPDNAGNLTRTGRRHLLDAVTLLAPCRPSKIVAVGLNYRSHAEEIQMKLPEEPLLFLNPSTAVIGPGDTIVY